MSKKPTAKSLPVAAKASKPATSTATKAAPAKKAPVAAAPAKKAPVATKNAKPAAAKPAAPPEAPKEPQMSKEELEKIEKQNTAATKIQCSWRSHQAKKQVGKMRVEKAEYEEKMKNLEQEAFLQMIKYEQEKEERKRMKELKEKQERAKVEKRKKKFIEAAYDGDLNELKHLIDELNADLRSKENADATQRRKYFLNLIDAKDSNNNTALSEASASGSKEVVEFLLSNGAEPNSKGAFERTPLWRAAFAGHLETAQVLLENGADPRIYSSDGQKPVDAATQPHLKALLDNWNIKLTEQMLEQIRRTRNQFKQEQMRSLEAQKDQAEDAYRIKKQEFDLVKNGLLKCNQELQRLHDEYLLNEAMYAPLIDAKEAEKCELTAQYETVRESAVKARILFKEALNAYRKEKKQLSRSDGDGSDDDGDEEADDDEGAMKVNIREIDDLVLRDYGGKIASASRWPLIIDPNDQATTFLRYRDTNYVNCLDTRSMQPERFRVALLGSLRYGKPLVLDLMQYDEELLEAFKTTCGMIGEDLFERIMDKSVVKREVYTKLIRASDGAEYEPHNFSDLRLKNFKVLFVTSAMYPCDALTAQTHLIRIVVNQ